jgi:hypothetical protein
VCSLGKNGLGVKQSGVTYSDTSVKLYVDASDNANDKTRRVMIM